VTFADADTQAAGFMSTAPLAGQQYRQKSARYLGRRKIRREVVGRAVRRIARSRASIRSGIPAVVLSNEKIFDSKLPLILPCFLPCPSAYKQLQLWGQILRRSRGRREGGSVFFLEVVACDKCDLRV
jgi:hypothetical protein